MKLEKETIHKCDVCGKQSKWIKCEWATHIFSFDMRSDMEFEVCSEYCDRILLAKSLKERRKLWAETQNEK